MKDGENSNHVFAISMMIDKARFTCQIQTAPTFVTWGVGEDNFVAGISEYEILVIAQP